MALEPRSTKLTHISLRSAVQVASHGMFVTRVDSVGIVDLDGAGAHVLCAVPGGVYETLDGAASWSLVNGSARFGSCNTITRGHIGGRPHMLLSCSVGVVNVEIVGDGTAALGDGGVGGPWSVISARIPSYLSVTDGNATHNTKLGACMGVVALGTIINATTANWTMLPDWPCTMLALHPTREDEFIYTHPPLTYRTLDGGKTKVSLNHSNIFHCGIDRKGWYYTAAMGGAFFSDDQGHSWAAYYDNRTARRNNVSRVRVPHDYQRIPLPDFGAAGVAFVSDQGLYIKPEGNATQLISANGNMSNNIAMQALPSTPPPFYLHVQVPPGFL